jgi:peptidoglycan/LPS O-acetylase OafA/YrhL
MRRRALRAIPILLAVMAASQVTGAALTAAIANITLGSASLKLSYTRPQ